MFTSALFKKTKQKKTQLDHFANSSLQAACKADYHGRRNRNTIFQHLRRLCLPGTLIYVPFPLNLSYWSVFEKNLVG